MLNTAKLQELNRYGAILVAGEVKNANRVYTEYALVYKGELVIKGEKASFIKRVERFFEKAKNKGIKEYLEKIIEFRKVGIGSIKYTKIISRNMLKQEHQMSCAAACLKQYSTDFGFNFTEEVIRTMAKTTEETGTFPSGMKSAFEEIFKNDIIDIGMKYVPNISDIDMAKKLTKDGSWIAFVLPKNSNVQHSIIVDKIIGNNVHIRDPWPLEKIFSEGRNGVEAIIDIYEFEHMWMYGQNWCFRIIK